MDIDIDVPSTLVREQLFTNGVRASMVKDGKLVPHPCGIYLQNMPRDPVTKLSAIPHDEAQKYGFTKIDLLHLHLLDSFHDKEEVRRLIKKEPKWSLLNDPGIVSKLFQLGNNADLVLTLQPRSILEIADCIALIRPGKMHLIPEYIEANDRNDIRTRLYDTSNDKYSYKKGHAIAYAMVVILQLHLLGHTNVIE